MTGSQKTEPVHMHHGLDRPLLVCLQSSRGSFTSSGASAESHRSHKQWSLHSVCQLAGMMLFFSGPPIVQQSDLSLDTGVRS